MADIHFGTDGWRAIIGEGFTVRNLVRVVDAAARTFKEAVMEAAAIEDPAAPTEGLLENPGVLYVGHDCRQDAHAYAAIAAQVAAEHGFEVKLTQDYCPTPTLCWSVAHDDEAVGGIMLTSSHNPAEYLGVKLRMADGGASPAEFTDKVEATMDAVGSNFDGSEAIEELAGLSVEQVKEALAHGKTVADLVKVETAETKPVMVVDLMTPYLAALKKLVDADAIRNANLRVVIDPLFGAGRNHLAGVLRDMGVEVVEIDNDEDPTFDGLHPEPIPPWVDRGLAKVKELGYDALFINDGDADRIGAGDSEGNFVNPHRIITLVVKNLAERGEKGRVVSTVTASALLDRLCKKLGIEYVTTPVGFKWIYGEMAKGGVMVGGEESGGIGIPDHVMERDGLLMALLLTEMMAKSGKDLGQLVQEMLDELGNFEFARRGLTVTDEQMKRFREQIVPNEAPAEVRGRAVVGIDRRDGVKIMLEGDSWVMMRPSGTEPLIRIYAESSESVEDVEWLLDWAEQVVTGE